MNENEDESLSEFLSTMNFKYKTFLENLKFPVTGVTIFDGKNFGPVKLGIVKLTAKDFGLDNVDNTSDSDKPVNNNHRAYIDNRVSEISEQISYIMENIGDWNKHVYDYSNPHKVTWEQVTGGSPINPTELVDANYVETSIENHNISSDMSTLHPEIMAQITSLQSKVDQLEKIIQNIENDLSSTIKNIAEKNIDEHNSSPSSHPFLISKLNQLSLDITAAIDQYSGMNGMEFTSNRIDDIDLTKLNDRWDETYDGKYPSVNGIKKLLDDMDFNMYNSVDHLEDTTTGDISSIVKSNMSGIIFANIVDGIKGAHIFVYKHSRIVASYSLPSPAPIVTLSHVENAPTISEAQKKYGRNSAIILADRSTSSTKHQSIVLWSNETYYEYIINTMIIDNRETIYGADYAPSNIGFDYSKFTTGHGILFVTNLSGSSQPGVVLYNKGSTPETQEINYGSTLNGLEIEKQSFVWTGNGSKTITFKNKYSSPPNVLPILEGFNIKNTSGSNLTIEANASSVSQKNATILYNITSGVDAKYSVIIIGKINS